MQQLKAFMGGDDDHVGVGGGGDWIGSKRGGWKLWMLLKEGLNVSGAYQLVEEAVLKTAYSV